MQLVGTKIGTGEKRDEARQFLLETVLGKQEVCRIRYTPPGKPFLPGGPYFSLSHSREWLLLGVGDEPMGVDIEWHKQMRDFAGIAKKAGFIFSDTGEFYDRWTNRESLVKLQGEIPLEDVELRNYYGIPFYSISVATRRGVTFPRELTLLR